VIRLPERLTLDQLDLHYAHLRREGLLLPGQYGPIGRHVSDGDTRLLRLRYDNSPAALRLWDLLLTEEQRLAQWRASGKRLVGAMKDLGTVPVMAYSSDRLVAFYPDGAWWIPCVMEVNQGLLSIADSLGIDESFCPVRAMLGAFVTGAHFPIPDLLVCSVGAACDDFAAIAQRLNGMGLPILWWEMPYRRQAGPSEQAVQLPGGVLAPKVLVDLVRSELGRVRSAFEELAGKPISDQDLANGINKANRVRLLLQGLRRLVFTSVPTPMPALEMLIAEMLAIHFCSDIDQTILVLEAMLAEVEGRVAAKVGYGPLDAVRVFWVNPVADLRVMNLIEECGIRLCGTDLMFTHAIDPIPADLQPMEALARVALADPMVGPMSERAARIAAQVQQLAAEAVVVSRIPGASHCGYEGQVIADIVARRCYVPTIEIEVPPVADSVEATLRTRLQALVETIRSNRPICHTQV